MWTYNYSNELYHHGVKGQKWGVRNDKKRFGSGKKKNRQEDWSDDAKEASLIKKKKVNQMSNAELRKLNERQNLERTHYSLNPSAISKGIKYIGIAGTVTGSAITLYKNSDKIIKIGKKIVQSISSNNKTKSSNRQRTTYKADVVDSTGTSLYSYRYRA